MNFMKLFSVALFVFLTGVVQADSTEENELDDLRTLVGTLDSYSSESIVVSDMAFPVSKLVSCYDRSGRRYVGCSGIEKARWVEVSISFESNQVLKIRKVSKADYEELSND